MEFFTSAIDTLKVLVIALGAGLGVWGVINLLEGYGNDNPGANAQNISLPLVCLNTHFSGSVKDRRSLFIYP